MKTVNPSQMPFFARGVAMEDLPYFFASFVVSRPPDLFAAALQAAMTHKPLPKPSELTAEVIDADCIIRAAEPVLAFGYICHQLGSQGLRIEHVKCMPRPATEEEIAEFKKINENKTKEKMANKLPIPSLSMH